LVRVLPVVARETVFALKGGTAINLFVRDLPRLSVDIDLTYLPIRGRAESLQEIGEVFDRLSVAVERQLPDVTVHKPPFMMGAETRLVVRQGGCEIKIETSPVARGVVHSPRMLETTEAVQAQFGFVTVQAVSFEDLFAGKIVAALDRQHPRDLYDIYLLFEAEGIDDGLFRTFLAYAVSSRRPLHELLAPNLKPIDEVYSREFVGMTRSQIDLDDLYRARSMLITEIQSRIDDNSRHFLLSVHDGNPDFTLIGLPQAAQLPAIRWKQQNIKRLLRENPAKHAVQRDLLRQAIGAG
jgi:predicted nucleotidyltransferase component of viral defense system